MSSQHPSRSSSATAPARLPARYAAAAQELLGIGPADITVNNQTIEIQADAIKQAIQRLENSAEVFLDESLTFSDPLDPRSSPKEVAAYPRISQMLDYATDSDQTPKVFHSSL